MSIIAHSRLWLFSVSQFSQFISDIIILFVGKHLAGFLISASLHKKRHLTHAILLFNKSCLRSIELINRKILLRTDKNQCGTEEHINNHCKYNQGSKHLEVKFMNKPFRIIFSAFGMNESF